MSTFNYSFHSLLSSFENRNSTVLVCVSVVKLQNIFAIFRYTNNYSASTLTWCIVRSAHTSAKSACANLYASSTIEPNLNYATKKHDTCILCLTSNRLQAGLSGHRRTIENRMQTCPSGRWVETILPKNQIYHSNAEQTDTYKNGTALQANFPTQYRIHALNPGSVQYHRISIYASIFA